MIHDRIIGRQVSFMKQTFECISYSPTHYRMNFTLHPGGSIPGHRHPFMDELFEIREGGSMFTLDRKESLRTAGEQVHVPRGQLHAIRNTSAHPMHCTVTYTPGSDTHRMFAIYTDLHDQGYREATLMMKGEYLCLAAGLETFAESAGVLRVVEKTIQSVLKVIGKLKGWDKEAVRYRDGIPSAAKPE
ncbi:MAG: cupin domain-containing protein [Bacteroidota bacterium]